MSQFAIVIIFPETENQMELGIIIEKAQELFKGRKGVSAKLTKDVTAERVIKIVEGEYDEKLMRRAVAGTRLQMVLPQEEPEREDHSTEPGVHPEGLGEEGS